MLSYPSTLLAAFVSAAAIFLTATASLRADEAAEFANQKYRVAHGFQKKQLYKQAAGRWLAFIAEHPKHERVDHAHYHLGVCQFQVNDLAAAAATFQKVLKGFPQFKSRDAAHFNLGLVHYNAALVSKKPADFKSAATHFSQLPGQFAKSDYRDDAAYYQAECLYLAGEKPAAIPVYKSAIAAFPTSPLLLDFRYSLGTIEQELEKYDEAASTFEALIKKFPQGERSDECRLRLGMVQVQRKDFAAAERILKPLSAQKDFPLVDYALSQYGEALLAQPNKANQAAGVFESLPKKFPQSEHVGSALLAAGRIRFQDNKFPQALSSLRIVVDKKLPEAPQAAFWLGRTLIAMKKPNEAVSALDRTLAAFLKSEAVPQLELTRIDAIYELPARRKETIGLYAGFAQKHAAHALAGDALYMASLAALNEHDYQSARTHSAAFIANGDLKAHAQLTNVLYIAGESRLLGEPPDPVQAEQIFRRLVLEFPKHERTPQAQVRIGFCLYKADKGAEAIAFLNQAVTELKTPEFAAEARVLIGRIHSDAKRHKEAAAAYRATIAAHPKWERNDEALYLLGLSLHAGGDVNGAQVELRNLASRYPKSTFRDRGFHLLGKIAEGLKQHDEAIGHFRRVVSEVPASPLVPSARYGVASAHFEKKDDPAAIVELTLLLQKSPDSELAKSGRYLRALCHQRQQTYDAAAVDFEAFLAGEPPKSNVLDARFALGMCRARLKDHAKAVASFKTLIAEGAGYADRDKAHYEMAFSLLALEKGKEAADAFRTLATQLPASPLAAESWLRVGQYHEESQQSTEAAKAYAAGLAIKQNNVHSEQLGYKLGHSHYSAKKYDEALKALQAQVSAFPKGALVNDGKYLAAECLYQQNKHKEALPQFMAVVSARVEKYQARALYRSGDCAAALKNWPESERLFKALIAQFPKLPEINEARYGLGLALQNQNKLEDAQKVYLEITEATRTETAAKSRFMMGEIAFAQKRFDDAVGHFIELTEGYPAGNEYAQWHALGSFELGRAFIELKRNKQAREALEAFVKRFPKDPKVDNARALIARLPQE